MAWLQSFDTYGLILYDPVCMCTYGALAISLEMRGDSAPRDGVRGRARSPRRSAARGRAGSHRVSS